MKGRMLVFGGRLDRYIGRQYLASYAAAFLVLIGLFLIIDLSSHLNTFLKTWEDGSKAPVGMIVEYCLLTIPLVFLQVAPFVALIGGLFTASRLLKFNEVTAGMAAGISKKRILVPILVGAALSGGVMIGLRETINSRLAERRTGIRYVLENQSFDEVYENLWIRALDGSTIHIREFRPAAEPSGEPEIVGLAVSTMSKDKWWEMNAKRGVFESRGGVLGWWLEEGIRTEIQNVEVHTPVDMLPDSVLTPASILTSYRASNEPMDLTYREVRQLLHTDPDNAVYRTLLHHHFTFPIANLVLVLVGVPLLLQSMAGRRAERLVLGCLMCIFYFAFDFVLMNFGLHGGISPLFGAWLPVLVFGSLGVVLFDSLD
ncbi:MAG: LptF/LptG family permease [Planctomycetes bacterium]|nr:LptF/LptG family permease [Planctomycetota bacterium]MCB9913419.1 LptF/LptG family permease [Planctomycetota bacterium]HPF12944.1 LptF/LptG family permease [Planctomycetota bacterium]HRV80144.1 LptF/LptG family permease [Planctomycetota bacterium]